MRTLRTVAELRAAIGSGPRPVGLVPTMGALHDGHLSLIERAAQDCGQIVVSVFVNPTQFNEQADFEQYPHDEKRDAELAQNAGATLLFCPAPAEVYPDGFATSVQVKGPLTQTLEGAHRGAAHFHGVTTIVTKLLNMVKPDVAYFGQKDAQQALVIRRLVTDLDIDAKIEVLPTVRDPGGLALSSRNSRLSDADRQRARALIAALETARATVRSSADARVVRKAAMDALQAAGVEPEYLEIVNPETLVPVEHVNGSGALVAVAARVGSVRLIDNILLEPNSTGTSAHVGGRKTGRKKDSLNMQRTMLKSKIHRATITDSDLHYVGSITIDADLLEAADIREHEQVHVLDIDNGARFETYTIAGVRGSGEMKINGAAARLVHTSDTIIVVSYANYTEAELESYEPRVVHVKRQTNEIITVDDAVAELLS